MRRFFRHPRTHNEMMKNADPSIKCLIRPKRRHKNLPNSWDDYLRCDDVDTPRQIRRSKNNFRKTIRFYNGDSDE